MTVGSNTAIKANLGAGGIAVIVPTYLIATDIAVEAISTLMINPALLSIFLCVPCKPLNVGNVSLQMLASLRQSGTFMSQGGKGCECDVSVTPAAMDSNSHW